MKTSSGHAGFFKDIAPVAAKLLKRERETTNMDAAVPESLLLVQMPSRVFKTILALEQMRDEDLRV